MAKPKYPRSVFFVLLFTMLMVFSGAGIQSVSFLYLRNPSFVNFDANIAVVYTHGISVLQGLMPMFGKNFSEVYSVGKQLAPR